MKLSLLAAACLLTISTSIAIAGYGSGDPRLEKLYATYTSPCCWRDDLTIHQSGTADKLRADIKAMVDAGWTDDQIKTAMVKDYGTRILVVPEGGMARWLFKMPWILGALGLALVAVFLRRMRHTAPAGPGEIARAQ